MITESKAYEGILNMLLKNENDIAREQATSDIIKRISTVSQRLKSLFVKEFIPNRLFFINEKKCLARLKNGTPIIIEYEFEGVIDNKFNHPNLGEIDISNFSELQAKQILAVSNVKNEYRIKKITMKVDIEMKQYIYDLAENFVSLTPIDKVERFNNMTHERLDLDEIFSLGRLTEFVAEDKIKIKYGYSNKFEYRILKLEEYEQGELNDRRDQLHDSVQHMLIYYKHIELTFI